MAIKSITISLQSSNIPQIRSKVDEACKRALEICGGKGESYAKANCPVQTGNLRNSITHRAEGDKTMAIGTSVFYAPYVEYGHHQQPGRYVPAIGKRLVASYVEGKHFFTKAMEGHVGEFKAIILSELKKIG